MIAEVPVKGYFSENCYFCIDEATKHGFLIDPGAEAEKLISLIHTNCWMIEKILLTHGHFDHTDAVNKIRDALQIPAYAYENANMYLLDPEMNLSAFCRSKVIVQNIHFLHDEEKICLLSNPGYGLKVMHTPGHTPDSVTYYAECENAAFVGDTIFRGSIGEYRYPGGNAQDLRRSIITKIFTLPEETILFSGHSEKTTVNTEKRRYGYERQR